MALSHRLLILAVAPVVALAVGLLTASVALLWAISTALDWE